MIDPATLTVGQTVWRTKGSYYARELKPCKVTKIGLKSFKCKPEGWYEVTIRSQEFDQFYTVEKDAVEESLQDAKDRLVSLTESYNQQMADGNKRVQELTARLAALQPGPGEESEGGRNG